MLILHKYTIVLYIVIFIIFLCVCGLFLFFFYKYAFLNTHFEVTLSLFRGSLDKVFVLCSIYCFLVFIINE